MKPTIRQVREALDFAECALSHERFCRECAEGGCLTVDADGRHGCPDCTNDEAQARLRTLAASLEGYVLVPREPTPRMIGTFKVNFRASGSVHRSLEAMMDELAAQEESK